MATYQADLLSGSLQVTERPMVACPEALRGSSARLGVDNYALEMAGDPPYDPLVDPAGLLHYELTDHLGNVTAVVTDELLPVDLNGDTFTDYHLPNVVSAQGYEPFGSLLPGRVYDKKQAQPILRLRRMLEPGENLTADLNGTPVVLAYYTAGYTSLGWYVSDIVMWLNSYGITASAVDNAIHITNWPANAELTCTDDLAVLEVSSYDFGFNGMRKDDEMYGIDGASYISDFRNYNSLIGRWISIDPKRFPWESSYSFSGNNPIYGSDPGGDLCIPCVQFAIGFALDVIEQIASEYLDNPNAGISGAIGEVNLWTATISGAVGAASPASWSNKLATSPILRKIVKESIETITDMAQSALNSYIKDGEIDVYDLLMEGLLGTTFRNASELIPVRPSSSLDQSLKQAKDKLSHDTRVAGPTPRPARQVRVENSQQAVDKVQYQINKRAEIVRDAAADGGKMMYKQMINELIREKSPVPLEAPKPPANKSAPKTTPPAVVAPAENKNGGRRTTYFLAG